MKRKPVNLNRNNALPDLGRVPATEHIFVLVGFRTGISPDGRQRIACFHTHVFTCLIEDGTCLPYRRLP